MSKLSAKNVSTQGRKFFAKIAEVEEQTKPFTDLKTGETRERTQLMLRFSRPDGKYELEWYGMPDGDEAISARSDLGKLINYFAKMGISDIGEDDYAPIRDLYVQCEVFPRQRRDTGEPSDKRFPVAKMSREEVAEQFGDASAAAAASAGTIDPVPIYEAVLPDMLPALEGLNSKLLYTKLASVQAVASHPQAQVIFEKAHSGDLLKWLESAGHVSVADDGTISTPPGTIGDVPADDDAPATSNGS